MLATLKRLRLLNVPWTISEVRRAISAFRCQTSCLTITSSMVSSSVFEVCGSVKERQHSLDDNEIWYGMKERAASYDRCGALGPTTEWGRRGGWFRGVQPSHTRPSREGFDWCTRWWTQCASLSLQIDAEVAAESAETAPELLLGTWATEISHFSSKAEGGDPK